MRNLLTLSFFRFPPFPVVLGRGGNFRILRILPLGAKFAHFEHFSFPLPLKRLEAPGQAMAASLVLAWATATNQNAWYNYDKPSSCSPL